MSSRDNECDACLKFLDYVRYTFSTIITLASLGLIIYAIIHGYAAMPGNPVILLVLFVIVTVLLAYLEGLQVAIMALEKQDRELFKHKKRSYNNHVLATKNRGKNVQRFLVGRQFYVVFVVFVFAQLTTYSTMRMDFLPPFLFTLIIETGTPGVLFVLSFGQLMPQLVASTHPITFLGLPGSWSVIKMALAFETAGVTHFSWVLTFITKYFLRMDKRKKKNVTEKKKPINPAIQNTSSSRDTFASFVTRESMTVDVMDAEGLYAGAQNGMVSASKEDIIAARQWTQDESVKNIYRLWGCKTDSIELPSSEDIVRYLVKNGKDVPRYLLPKNHPKHIPPHIVVMELTRKEEERIARTSEGNIPTKELEA